MNDFEMDQELEAKNVYVLLKKDYRISRNLRAEWFFKNINNTIELQKRESLVGCEEVFEVVSIIPKEPPGDWPLEPTNYKYKVTPSTFVTYLAWKYRLVFCLDLTPTVAVVDIQHGELLVDEIATNLEKCLDGLTRPFKIQGSSHIFQPQLFVTVVAHVPYLRSETNQVLVQGWVVTRDNFGLFLEHVQSQLLELENSLAAFMQTSYDKMSNDKFKDGLLSSNSADGNIDMQFNFAPSINPDLDFVTLVRYGILSLQLLPENATAGVIVVTSGIVSTPNILATEMLLTQLRGSAISCSFLQLGSSYHPNCCLGYVPYLDFMKFISAATQGTYFSKPPELSSTIDYEMNCYQEAFYTWGFQRPATNMKVNLNGSRQPHGSTEWLTRNRYFYSHKESPLRRRKHQDSNIHTSLNAMLSCRLREGYMVKNVQLKDNNHLQISMVLLWKHNVIVEYVMSSKWPPISTSQSWHYEMFVEGSYDFLHDWSYPLKKFHSINRTTVIKRFRNLLAGSLHTDQLLVHLHSFANNPVHFTIPESVKNRIPLFTVAQNSNNPLPYTSGCAHPNFESYWKPVCMLDISVWQKWVHTHRISLILEHDHPLPKNFHLPTMSGRYQNVQCRQAMAAVHTMLTEWSSFVLVENHSYIKFLYSDPDKPPTSFYVTRVTAKAPCMVIRLAFLGGTDGEIRNRTLRQMREKVLSLTFPQRPVVKDTRVRKGLVSNVMDRTDCGTTHKHPLQRGGSQINCCILFTKPLDKILIRYETVPLDFFSLTLPTAGTSLSVPPRSPLGHPKSVPVSTVSTLCRYLHHRRWIWAVESSSEISAIPLQAVARMLSTLIKIRTNEGFNIAHSHSGMLNMVLEVEMKNTVVCSSGNEQVCQGNETRACIVQYLLFPPHRTTLKESVTSEDGGEAEAENGETDGELQLITECWVEPQIGIVTSSTDHKSRRGLNYKQIADSFFPRDHECISTMVTFEHLSLLCQNTDPAPSVPFVASPTPTHQPFDAAIQHVPFSFDVIQILPKCHQTEMLFSTYQRDFQYYVSDTNDASNQILMELLFDNLARLHDREIYMSPRDNLLFPVQIRERNNSSLPLLHHGFTTPCVSEKDMPGSPRGTIRNRKISVAECAGKTPNWRCFVKGVSSTHVFITFIPASYTDVKMLTYSDLGQHLSKQDEIRDITSISIDQSTRTDRISLPTDAEITHSPLRKPSTCSISELSNTESPTKTSNSRYGLVVLPIYVYDCPLATLMNQLVCGESTDRLRDISIDLTFKSKELGEDTVTLRSDTPRSSRDSKQPSPEPRSEESYASSKRSQATQHCDSVKAVFSKCFVVGVFRSLHLNYHIHTNDIQSVVDDICNESLLEIDITNFIQTVCGHVRDFKVKSALEQLRWSTKIVPTTSVATDTGLQENRSDVPVTVKVGEDQIAIAPKFPVALLQSSHCEILRLLHDQIRSNFGSILRKSFLPIPSNLDYFFYCLPSFHQSRSKSELMTEKGSSTGSPDITDGETDTFKSEVVEFRDSGLSYSRKPSGNGFSSVTDQDTSVPTEVTSQISIISNVDSESVASIVGEGIECNDDAEDDVPPLFVHLMCTVKTKNNVSSYPVRCIPTCLAEINPCLEHVIGELDLNDVHITLDIICLTLPSEFDSISVGKSLRTTSFCSVSPLPLDVVGSNDETDGLQASPDDCYPNETQGDQLSHLPEFQHQAVTNFMEEIKWMLRDEIASAMLEFFPLTEKTLDMVASHVQSSPGRPGCVIEEVPLQFVFGSDQSLDKFIMEFKQMALTGYHLSQEGEFHYLAVNRNSSGKRPSDATQRQIQQMAVASKFILVQTAPHADDGTELRQMEKPTFSDGEDGARRSGLDGDFASKEQCEENPSPRRVKPSDDSLQEGDDTENEELPTKTENGKSKREKYSPKGRNSFSVGTSNEAKNLQLLSDARKVLAVELDGGSVVMSDADVTSLPLPLLDSKVASDMVDEMITQKQACILSQVIHQRHSSGPTMSTPGLASDVSSLVGSGQCSNTEDGYDGDSSDVDNDGDWTSDLETQHPCLPKFWLILKVSLDKVFVYFHARDTEENDEKLQLWKDLYHQVIKNIQNICKIVNQTLLLQDLHDSRMCNQLLEPETSEDIWKYDDHLFSRNRRNYYNSRSYDDSPVDSTSEYHDNFLKANLDFMPGTFSCNVVWQTHFMLHSRLKTGPGRTGVSRGIQAMRGVLNTLSVSNRENMFVYAETSGAVFYLRLNESQCPVVSQMGGSESFSGSRSSSIAMLPLKRSVIDGEEEISIPESRSRVNSMTDRDHGTHDSISVTSRTSTGRQKMEDTIQLLVHGISEVGPEIKEDLVHVLQKRLDEAVLDIISVTLSRNPMCKLTSEDVQFIQKPKDPHKALIQFTVCPHAQPFLQAMFSYLKQNLLQFLNVPKYIDGKPEAHFQDYNPNSAETEPLKEGEAFLYIRPQGSGNKGIGLLALSMVDGRQGNPIQYFACPRLSPLAYQENLDKDEFDMLTSTTKYEPSATSGKYPGPWNLIQLRIWQQGTLDLDQLTNMLKGAVRHTLWDVGMEYRLLTAPLAEMDTPIEGPGFSSEPATPVKDKKSRTQESVARKDRAPSPLTLVQVKFRELSSSVPDLIVKSRSPVTSPKEPVSAFKLAGSPVLKTSILPHTDSDVQIATEAKGIQRLDEQGNKGTLHMVYSKTMQEWLEFAVSIGVPTVKKHTLTLKCRYTVDFVLAEFQSLVNNLVTDTTLRTFRKVVQDGEECYIPHAISQSVLKPRERRADQSPEDSKSTVKSSPGKVNCFILIGRDFKQWRATTSYLYDESWSEVPPLLAPSFFPTSHRNDLKFPPVIVSNEVFERSESTSCPVTAATYSSNAPSLSGTSGAPSFSTNSAPGRSPETSGTVYIPRQKLLLIIVNDKQIFLYTYNWSMELVSKFQKQTTRIVQWNNLRSKLLSSLVCQKIGLFYNGAYVRKRKTKNDMDALNATEAELFKFTTPPNHDVQSSSYLSRRPSASRSNFNVVELLRDSQPSRPIHRTPFNHIRDPVLKHGHQMQEMRNTDRKEQQKKLNTLLQSSPTHSNAGFTEESLQLLKQASRIEHFCLTPLLFMPHWRCKVAGARDHTIPSLPQTTIMDSLLRNRNDSDGSSKILDRRQSITLPIVHSAQNSPRQLSFRTSNDDVWHMPLCTSYIHEFTQYLQNLGFVPLQMRPHGKQKEITDEMHMPIGLSLRNNTCYVQKTLVGGSLIVLELSIIEPYFSVRMYSLEGTRIYPERMKNQQFMLAFVDECDKLKVVIHLHSFTYDYHLRSIHSYVSGRQLIFRQGYHLTSFLDDFVRYYQKSPNFAWNLIYQDVMTIDNTNTVANVLFDHLLKYDKLYGMQVLRMVPFVQDDRELDNEYVLVELSSRKVSYKDCQENRRTDDFDISLLISHDLTAAQQAKESKPYTLFLKYYIVLTSRRELYPRAAMDKKLGKFRTVLTATPIPSRKVSLVSMERPEIERACTPTVASRKTSLTDSDRGAIDGDTGSQLEESFHESSFKAYNRMDLTAGSEPSSPALFIDMRDSASDSESTSVSQIHGIGRHRGIRQESVNYLGYFSTNEELMNQIMQEQVEIAKIRIYAILETAMIHCKRDSMWNRLVMGQSCGLTFCDISELLNLVVTQPLDSVDSRLTPFLNLHVTWYQGLIKVLVNKYPERHRSFTDPNGTAQHVMLVNPSQNRDMMILLSVEPKYNRAYLHIVFRTDLPNIEQTLEQPNFHLQALQILVEEFVNVCCVHLWACLI